MSVYKKTNNDLQHKKLSLSYKQSVNEDNIFTFKINNTLKIFNATDLTLSTGFIC